MLCACMLSHARLFETLCTVAYQTALFMEFSRQEYWKWLPFPNPGDLPDPGIEPVSLASPELAVGFFTTTPPGKPHLVPRRCLINVCWMRTYDNVDSFPRAWWEFLVIRKNFLKESVDELEAREGAVFPAQAGWICSTPACRMAIFVLQLRKAAFIAP